VALDEGFEANYKSSEQCLIQLCIIVYFLADHLSVKGIRIGQDVPLRIVLHRYIHVKCILLENNVFRRSRWNVCVDLSENIFVHILNVRQMFILNILKRNRRLVMFY